MLVLHANSISRVYAMQICSSGPVSRRSKYGDLVIGACHVDRHLLGVNEDEHENQRETFVTQLVLLYLATVRARVE